MVIYEGRLYKRIKAYMKNEEVIQVSIVGLQGRGKTNVCKWFNNEFGPDYAIYVNVNMLENFLDDLYIYLKNFNTIEDYKGANKFALILDDISFGAMHYSKSVKEVLQWLSTIRHRIRANQYMIVTVFHYPYGALPFLRETPIKVLMSYDKSYRKAFEDDFPRRYFIEFAKDLDEWLLKGKKGLALVNALGKYEITSFPKVEKTNWIDRTKKISGMGGPSKDKPHVKIAVKAEGYVWDVYGNTLRLKYWDRKAKKYITVAVLRTPEERPIVDEESGEILYNPNSRPTSDVREDV